MIYLLFLCLFGAGSASAQRLFRVSVENKTVNNGKMSTVAKDLYYSKDGNLNIHYSTSAADYWSVSTPFGFTTMYYPATNECMTLDANMFAAEDELFFLFATGSGEDLGMARSGFVLKSTRRDGDNVVRRYEPVKEGGLCKAVEIAYDKNYLPIYCAYYARKDKIITKTYLSHYTSVKDFVFPMRVTEISYSLEKNDSTVRLDLYRNLQIDTPDDNFNFHIPSGAKPLDMKKELKGYKRGKQ